MLCKLSSYDLLNESACTDIDPAGAGAVWALAGRLARLDTVLAENDFKIKALTFALAYYKRVRFGKASEAIIREQRTLFDETVDMDLAAIDEELRSQATTKPPRKRAGRQPLPPELPRIKQRDEPASCPCSQCGAELVKIREDVTE